MLRSEGGLDAESAIGLSDRKYQHTKTGTLTLQDARLLCGKRMAYAAAGGGLDAEPAIRLSGRKDSIQKMGTLTLQDARLPCNKCRAYLRSEGVWTLSQRLDSPGRKGLDNGPTIRPLGRKDLDTKTGTLTLQDA